MINYQKIIIIGNTTDKAKIFEPEKKKRYCDFVLAVNRSRDWVDYLPVRCFDSLVETALKIKKGGMSVFVEGRVTITSYTVKDGTFKKSGRVIASQILLL